MEGWELDPHNFRDGSCVAKAILKVENLFISLDLSLRGAYLSWPQFPHL
jgi:hypothetical protein